MTKLLTATTNTEGVIKIISQYTGSNMKMWI